MVKFNSGTKFNSGRKLTSKTKTPQPSTQNRAVADPQEKMGPSPNPLTNMLLATVALRGGGMLVRRGIERSLLGKRYSPEKAKNILAGRTMAQTLVSTAVAKVATRSVPGAILVGGALLAKTLYDRRKGKAAEVEGEQQMAKIAEEGDPTTP